jgi:hypothetical protein
LNHIGRDRPPGCPRSSVCVAPGGRGLLGNEIVFIACQ